MLRRDNDAGVVTRGDGLAAVEVPGATQEGAELDDGVAVDARAGRAAVEVGGNERLDDAGLELPLQVHDVERDLEPGGDTPGIFGGVREQQLFLNSEYLSATSWSRIQTPTASSPAQRTSAAATDVSTPPDIATRIHPAHLRSAAGPYGYGGRAGADLSRRAPLDRPRLRRPASSISSSVVVRPSDSRSAPLASSAG